MKSALSRLAMWLVPIALALGTAGCGPSPADVVRMRDSDDDDGPNRLAEIVRAAKGSPAVQKEAAVGLVTLTRRGRHVGLERLVKALASRPSTSMSRTEQLTALSSELAKGMQLPRTPDDDPALAYKDGAYAILSSGVDEKTAARDELVAALTTWLRDSPLERLDDTRQRYGLRSLLHLLGPPSAKHLLRFMSGDGSSRALELVIAEGDDASKEAAAGLAAGVLTRLLSPEWRQKARELIAAADKKSNIKVTDAQLDAQVSKHQSNELTKLFGALGGLPYPESFEVLLGAAENTNIEASNRVLALAKLTPHAANLGEKQIDRILALALANPPHPQIGDREEPHVGPFGLTSDNGIARAAYACIAHAPRARPSLLKLVASAPSWGIATEAAYALLDGASASDARAVLLYMPSHNQTPLAPAQVSAIGHALAKLPGGKDVAREFLPPGSVFGPRLAALNAFAGDRATLSPFEKDTQALPPCRDTDPCEWKCDGHEVTTIGAYVRGCLEEPPKPRAQAPTGGGGHEMAPLPAQELLNILGGGADAGTTDGSRP